MKVPSTQKSRGFGFCLFESPEDAKVAVSRQIHVIDGKKVILLVIIIGGS